jgi:hypothetical protein
MGQVDENLNALQDDVVRRLALDVDHEPDAAGIALVGGIVQALFGGESVRKSHWSLLLEPGIKRV